MKVEELAQIVGQGTDAIKGDDVRFVPAVDVNRVMLVAGAVAIAAMLFLARPLLRR